MNAEAFRHLYGYHMAENRRLWAHCAALAHEHFVQPVGYAHGSVRAQLIHLMEADDVWFSELQNQPPAPPLPSALGDDRALIRAHWDEIEQRQHTFLERLQDDQLFDQPIREPDEDRALRLWQVLLHVANHATDHRAQLLRQLHDLGADTRSQDYIFYLYDHPL